MEDASEFDEACMIRLLGFAYHAAKQQDVNVADQLEKALDDGEVRFAADDAGVLVQVDGYNLTLVAWPLVRGEPPLSEDDHQ